MPYSDEESAALFLMGNTMARRGNFREAISYYEQTLTRNVSLDQRLEIYRQMGTCYYRLEDYWASARKFYEALQGRMNSVDQWLLRVALDQIKGTPPPLPESVLFPGEESEVDPANPPLLAFEDIAPKLR